MATDTNRKLTVRWMLRADHPDVLAIERECFAPEECWTEDELVLVLRSRNAIALVAEVDRKISGFVVYELRSGVFHIDNLAVGIRYRRTGVATALVDRLKAKLNNPAHANPRNTIETALCEYNVAGQLFLKSQKFRCTEVVPTVPGSGDSYRFTYHATN